MQLVQAPERFDVLVMPNMYGDIVVGAGRGPDRGAGVAPGAHFGDDVAVFEATHGTAPRLAGTNRADPIGRDPVGGDDAPPRRRAEAGDRLGAAVADVLAEGVDVTYDLRGRGTTAPPPGRPGRGRGGRTR